MELDLVTALTAANITVLQPSYIQQEVQPLDVPYLFVRLNIYKLLPYAHLSLYLTTCDYTVQFIVSISFTILSLQAKYARIIFLNMYENKATELLCHVSINQPQKS